MKNNRIVKLLDIRFPVFQAHRALRNSTMEMWEQAGRPPFRKPAP